MRFTLSSALVSGALMLVLAGSTSGTPIPESRSLACGTAYTESDFHGEPMPLWLDHWYCNEIALGNMVANISSVRVTDPAVNVQFFKDHDCPDGPAFEVIGTEDVATIPAEWDNSFVSYACSYKTRHSLEDRESQDDYAAHLYKGQHRTGEGRNIPTDTVCINLSGFFGSWDNTVRSLDVTAGNKCRFHDGQVCRGDSFEMGQGVKDTLPVFDKRISSVKCWKA